MYRGFRIAAVIPALNEEQTIATVVHQLKQLSFQNQPIIDQVIVSDNGSEDLTREKAKASGAELVFEAKKGYGAACQKGIEAAEGTDFVLILSADGAEKVSESTALLEALISGADIAIGSRTLGVIEQGALKPYQLFSNWMATNLIRLFWQHSTTDIGPFRAIRLSALKKLHLEEQDFGWRIEMQLKALRHGLIIKEVPVSCQKSRNSIKNSHRLLATLATSYTFLGFILYFATVDLMIVKTLAWMQGLLPNARS